MLKKVVCLFDVDGTLTKPRGAITDDMKKLLNKLKDHVSVALVGGSDLSKIAEQMGGPSVIDAYDYVFAENGLVAYKKGHLIGKESILNYIGEEKLQQLINYCLYYMSQINLPVKRGTFIEFRSGLINVCPIGRNCTQEERDFFEKYDKEHKVREKFIEAIRQKFPDLDLVYAIGGQISFDCFPTGWDKRYCLKHLEKEGFETIHFFGDKTFEGGNDFELFMDLRTVGHSVTSPNDTKQQLENMFLL